MSTNLSAESESSSEVYQEENSRWIGILHLFHFRDVADEGNVVHKVVELLQLTQVLYVILPDGLTEAKKQTFTPRHHHNPASPKHEKKPQKIQNLGDELSQSRVAEQQPASGRDAVGFILKLVGFQIAEITEPEGKTNVREDLDTTTDV